MPLGPGRSGSGRLFGGIGPMKDEVSTRPKHLQEHQVPTVIHDPVADETILARWLREALEKGPEAWIIAGVGISAVCLLWIVASSFASRPAASSQAWSELILAKSAEDRAKVGEKSSGPVASWALLQAAEFL